MIDLFLILSFLLNVLFVFLLYRFVKRTMQFDELFSIMMDDVKINADLFEDMLNTPVLSNSPEVVALHDNMTIMLERFNEYVNSMNDFGVEKKEE